MYIIKFFLIGLLFSLSLYGFGFGGSGDDEPVSDAGIDQILISTLTTTLDGSGSSDTEDDDEDLTYEWSSDNDDITFSDSSAISPDLNATDAGYGTYTITLKVTDSKNQSDEDDVEITFTPLNYINEYKCDIYYKSLTSYSHITSEDDNDKVYGALSISYPKDELDGNITCEKDDETQNCTRVSPPLNRYEHIVYPSSKTGTDEGTPSNPLEDLEYGDFSGDFDLTLEPAHSYDNSDRKVMLLGDVNLTGSQNTLSLQDGDYFLNSLTFDNNEQSIVISDDSIVRIFIENDLVFSSANMKINNDGDAGKFFIYTNGNAEFENNATFKGFMYTEGNTTLSDTLEFHGAIASEEEVVIKTDSVIYQDADAKELGYGECAICYKEDEDDEAPILTPYINLQDTLDGVVITEDSVGSDKNDEDDLSTLDQNNTDTGTDEAENSAGVYTYTFGDDYVYSEDDQSVYYQTSRENKEDDEKGVLHNAVFTDITDKYYDVHIKVCKSSSGDDDGHEYKPGGFDMWNMVDGDDDDPVENEDRNITTKVVSTPFYLSLASLNKTDDDYREKETSDDEDGTGIIKAKVYSNTNNEYIGTQWIDFDVSKDGDGEPHEDKEFQSDVADRNATVIFKICATYKSESSASAEDAYQKARDVASGGDGKIYVIYPFDDCDNDIEDDCREETGDDPTYHYCRAKDDFAIRPKKYEIDENTSYMVSGHTQSYSMRALRADDSVATNYDITSDDYELNVSTHKYMPDDSLNDDLHGDASASGFDFEDGEANSVELSFSDIGKVQFIVEDTEYAEVDKDDETPHDCSATGMYICGETNATFIPSHFHIQSAKIYNENNATFTYLSNDEDLFSMSSHIELSVVAQNEQNDTTQNFDKDSWNNPLDINISVTNDANETNITNQTLAFVSGEYKVEYSSSDGNESLFFNFSHDINSTKNPFLVKGSAIDFFIKSSYDGNHRYDDNGEDVTADANATFVYGKTNAPRTIFKKANTYKVPLYYEIYCYGSGCDKTLLPDGEDSLSTNDPRWYVNTQHTSAFGKAENITQKHGSGVSVDTAPTGNHPDFVKLAYDDSKLPYKTTMLNEAPSWLIYNKYNENANKNEFEIEILDVADDTTSWAGSAEEDVGSTQKVANERANRRVMW